jgi:hypothetical protein
MRSRLSNRNHWKAVRVCVRVRESLKYWYKLINGCVENQDRSKGQTLSSCLPKFCSRLVLFACRAQELSKRWPKSNLRTDRLFRVHVVELTLKKETEKEKEINHRREPSSQILIPTKCVATLTRTVLGYPPRLYCRSSGRIKPKKVVAGILRLWLSKRAVSPCRLWPDC